MKKNIKRVLLLIAGFALAFIFQSNNIFASEVTGSLCTGMNCPVEGTAIGAPTMSPVAGTYNATQSVTLTAAGSSGICYTTDGTTPVCATATTCSTGTAYSSSISVTSTKTIKAISCYPNSNTSSVSSSTYTLACATASVSNGSVSAYPTCSISCNSGYTLSGSSCVAVSSGGGGGGGGTGYLPSTTTVTPTTPTTPTTQTSAALIAAQTQLLNTLILQLQSLLQQAQAAGISLPAGTESFLSVTVPSTPAIGGKLSQASNLTVGSIGEDARNLQKFLNARGFTVANSGPGSPGNETSKFGALTRVALARFQASVGISPAVGYFGPVTRAYLESVGY